MKKRIMASALLFGISMAVLHGCNGTEDMSVPIETVEKIVEESEEESSKVALEESGELEISAHESMHSSTVLEDEKGVYFCGNTHILKWNKSDHSIEMIWKSDKLSQKQDPYEFAGAQGILVGDKIYFLEKWFENMDYPQLSESVYALSVVNTDGSGYKEIERVSKDKEAHLFLLDGILYYSKNPESKAAEGYVLDGRGDFASSDKVVNEPVNYPKGYMEISYFDNGIRSLTALESAYRFGYYLLRNNDFALCKVDCTTGEEELLGDKIGNCSLVSWNNSHLLFEDYSDSGLYLIDIQTWDKELLINTDDYIDIIGMDEEYLYWHRHIDADSFDQYVYERIDLEDGLVEELFVLDSFFGMPEASPQYLMDVSVWNDYLYYVGEQGYTYCLMRRNVNMPNAEEILLEGFYDRGIGEIGTITAYKENIYSDEKQDLKLMETDVEWLVVDERFPGAGKINEILDKEQQANMEYAKEIAADMEEWARDGMHGNISSRISRIYYFNERYISFTQQGYEYLGGAHGMPYWIPHMFDLYTGDELGLADILATSEEEFKEIVKDEFIKMYEADPLAYWDDAVETVYMRTDFNSEFYLNEEGIVIYYGPYELASYAAGFQEIVVPYEKLTFYDCVK